MNEGESELEALARQFGVTPTASATDPATPLTEPAGMFGLPQNRFQVYKAAQRAKRKNVKKFIRPENARSVLQHLPDPGDHTHCLLRGDFVLGDIIPMLLEGKHCQHLRIATLGMSEYNAQTLAKLTDAGTVEKITIVLSHYFEQVNKSTVYADCRRILEGKADFVVMRSHAKVICIRTSSADWVIEGSANLRSSDNLEQITIYNDADTLDFHADWIDYVLAHPPTT